MKTQKLFSILLAVILIAAVFVVPAFAQGETPAGVTQPVFDFVAIAKALETLIILMLLPSVALLAKFLSVKSSVEVGKLTEQQKAGYYIFLRTLVYAAEQMKAKAFINDKLTWVIERAEAWLDGQMLPIDLDQIRIDVEAIVAEELNFDKLIAASK
jgi:hypothetical protein